MKYFLIFYSDNGGREDCSVYYSTLVIAKDKKEAMDKYIAAENLSADEISELEALEMDPII